MNQITLVKIAVHTTGLAYKIICENRNCAFQVQDLYNFREGKRSKGYQISLCQLCTILNCRNCSTYKIGCQNRNCQLLSHVLFHIDDDLQHRNNVLKTSEKLVRSRSFYIELIRFGVDYHCGWLLAWFSKM